MMADGVELYCLELGTALEDEVTPMEKYFEPKRWNDILKFRHNSDRNRTIWGEILARTLIGERTGKAFDDVKIEREKWKKPAILGDCSEFNISHSGCFVAVAIGEKCGVDVETKKKDGLSVAKRFFLPAEAEFLTKTEKAKDFFLRLWTIKESFVKYTGEGLSQLEKVDARRLLFGEGTVGSRNFLPCDGVALAVTARKNSLPNKCIMLKTVGKTCEFNKTGEIPMLDPNWAKDIGIEVTENGKGGNI